MSLWAELFNKSGRPVQIENCHNPVHGAKNPFFKPGADPEACPMNMFRTGGDISANFGAIIGEAYSLVQYGDAPKPFSHPGCWAYPDMSEVGNFKGQEPQRSDEEQTHWGA